MNVIQGILVNPEAQHSLPPLSRQQGIEIINAPRATTSVSASVDPPNLSMTQQRVPTIFPLQTNLIYNTYGNNPGLPSGPPHGKGPTSASSNSQLPNLNTQAGQVAGNGIRHTFRGTSSLGSADRIGICGDPLVVPKERETMVPQAMSIVSHADNSSQPVLFASPVAPVYQGANFIPPACSSVFSFLPPQQVNQNVTLVQTSPGSPLAAASVNAFGAQASQEGRMFPSQ